MGKKILHITDGDNFTSTLKKIAIKGEIITWREMLCEGKTTIDVGSESFWKTRFQFLNTNYKITKNNFINNTLKEYRRLCNQKTQEEIVLWFASDLFSQINMIAVISWLKKHRKNVQVSLISHKTETLTKLSDLPQEKLVASYENRLQLTQDDVEYADYIWQLYCSDNPLRLETFSKFNSSQFKDFPNIIKAHILRFPTVKNGLNSVENDILTISETHKPTSKEKLIENVLKTSTIYGFEALQYQKIIYTLKPLFTSFNPVKLTKAGKQILHKTQNYYSYLKNDETYLGGSKKYSFLYHEASEKLLKL